MNLVINVQEQLADKMQDLESRLESTDRHDQRTLKSIFEGSSLEGRRRRARRCR